LVIETASIPSLQFERESPGVPRDRLSGNWRAQSTLPGLEIAQGRGTLITQWRIVGRDSDLPLKRGLAQLSRTGASPLGKPEVIPATLTELEAEFSRDLAQSIRESAKPMRLPEFLVGS
jgi:hypothetical protein